MLGSAFWWGEADEAAAVSFGSAYAFMEGGCESRWVGDDEVAVVADVVDGDAVGLTIAVGLSLSSEGGVGGKVRPSVSARRDDEAVSFALPDQPVDLAFRCA